MGATASRGMWAAKQRPVAEDSSGITSPRRRLAVTAWDDSSQCTMVGPRLPHTARARVWPMVCMSAGHAFARQAHRIQARQRGQAQLERRRAQVVVCGAAVLHHQPQALKAHQIAVGLGRAHAGRGRQVFQHERPARARQPSSSKNPTSTDWMPARSLSMCTKNLQVLFS